VLGQLTPPLGQLSLPPLAGSSLHPLLPLRHLLPPVLRSWEFGCSFHAAQSCSRLQHASSLSYTVHVSASCECAPQTLGVGFEGQAELPRPFFEACNLSSEACISSALPVFDVSSSQTLGAGFEGQADKPRAFLPHPTQSAFPLPSARSLVPLTIHR
jgi:hypothetical protein